MSYCVCVILPYGVPGRVWYLIVSILDLREEGILFNFTEAVHASYLKISIITFITRLRRYLLSDRARYSFKTFERITF